MQGISRLLMSAGCAALALAPVQTVAQAEANSIASVQLAQSERPKVTVLPLAHGRLHKFRIDTFRNSALVKHIQQRFEERGCFVRGGLCRVDSLGKS